MNVATVSLHLWFFHILEALARLSASLLTAGWWSQLQGVWADPQLVEVFFGEGQLSDSLDIKLPNSCMATRPRGWRKVADWSMQLSQTY